ncbi:MAG: hypothetical protein BWY52_02052 [Chloroflexi bacterium ADurb.Bin325]|nr:MAG: hypothetical protein BWY52_02052 [Chloroflexi bacterium ADurb.Bin325]
MASPYNLPLTDAQSAVATLPLDRRAFLEGPAGSGKTRAGVARIRHLLQSGAAGDQILVILPQRTLAGPYTEMLRHPSTPAGSEVTVSTMGGLAQRMIELFWPLVAFAAGFGRPDRPPVFLTLETAQYFMARIVRPLLDAGYFETAAVDRNRLYSQILDNLAKMAAVGYDHTEIGARLKAAWVGESSQLRVYDEAQECAARFRQYCLAHNFLDFSLQIEVFARHLWPLPKCRDYLQGRYRHLIIDNAEEDTPVSHDILLEWLPSVRSALVIYDTGAGYRRFLAADPASAYRLKAACEEQIAFAGSFVMSPAVAALSERLRRVLRARPRELDLTPLPPSPKTAVSGEGGDAIARPAGSLSPDAAASGEGAEEVRPALLALDYAPCRFHPQMLDWVAERIAGLVNDEGVSPGEIAVLSPFVTGGLRFSLENRLAAYGVPTRSHRPSRALAEEPATLALLTLTQLCHPHWRRPPTGYDLAHALMLSVDDMDLVRAQLLADIAYRTRDGEASLSGFDEIEPEMQERLTFLLGGRYEGLRTWLSANARLQAAAGRPSARDRKAAQRRTAELDHFLARLFGELLSQPGYAFHASFDAGEITANVIESARKFRQVMQLAEGRPPAPRAAAGQAQALVPAAGSRDAEPPLIPADLGREWVELVQDGVLAAQYIRSWQRQPEDAVLIAPAYTFLMSNRPVDHQFWLDVGSNGWWERLYQPLTQPYVLSRGWPAGAQWTDKDEYTARQEALSALVVGLTRRCRVQIHLGLAQMGATGVEQKGALLRAIQQVLRDR